MIQVMFNHGHDPRYGELPIGTIKELEEDSYGLRASVELHDGPDNENIRAALASGALRAMSIQFETMQEDFNDDQTERNIREVKLWEFGPVSFPANEGAVATLHSLAALAYDLDEQRDQPESPAVETRDSTLDEARLTWLTTASRRLELEDKELRAATARMANL